MNEFLTWDVLGTFAGCLGATVVITEFIKKIFPKIHPQIVSFVISLLILLGVQLVGGSFAWNDILLQVINAFVVSLAANGGFDAIKNAFGKNDDDNIDGQLVAYAEGEDGDANAYINFSTDPNGYKDGQKLTFVYKQVSQE